MYEKRILRLADALDEQPRKLFHMGGWFDDLECGTVCCAGGLACTIPAFKRAGLKRMYFKGVIVKYNGVQYQDPKTPGSATLYDFDALARFFDIPSDHAIALFTGGKPYPSKEPTPKQVARVLRKYVKDGGDLNAL